MKRICWMAVGTWLITLGAAAQDNAAMNQAKNTEDRAAMDQAKQQLVRLAAIGPDRFVLTAPVTGAPYSADEVTTFTQTLGDGTHIQREDKVTVYRDSQGRLRRETPTEITISDPVAGVAYSLDPNKLTARKMMVAMKRAVARNAAQGAGSEANTEALAPPPPPPPGGMAGPTVELFTVARDAAGSGPNTFFFANGGTVSMSGDRMVRQSLGTQSIEGVLSEGTGTTATIEAGSIGNDREIKVVDERWYSAELKTTTMTKHSDPRSGETVFRLTNVRRGEPSPDLFQLPAGYQVIESVDSVPRKTKPE